jgi:hypothetical protein
LLSFAQSESLKVRLAQILVVPPTQISLFFIITITIINMPLSFWNLERLRVMSACTVLVLGAVTVSSILSTAQMMKPLRILMEQVPRSAEYHPTKFVIMEQVPIISAEYHPAKFVVSYKTFAPDGSLETVTQDSISRKHRRLSQPNTNTNTKTGETETVDVDNDNQGHDLDQVRFNLRVCRLCMQQPNPSQVAVDENCHVCVRDFCERIV